MLNCVSLIIFLIISNNFEATFVHADCENGGTLNGTTCDCTTDWMGPNCAIAVSGTEIPTILAGLPTLRAYWPLSSNVGLLDVTANHIDGVQSTSLSMTTGPFGGISNAIQTTNSSGSTIGYVWFNSSMLNFNSASWTVSTFVYVLNAGSYPIFQYESGSAAGANIWQSTTSASVAISTASGVSATLPCALRNGWQFIGMTYDASVNAFAFFCNNSYIWTTTSYSLPITANYLYFGHRHVSTVTTAPAYFACASTFQGIVKEKQLPQVKQLCPLFQGIPCPSSCILETCQYSGSTPGFTCACQPGYSGIYCNSTGCDPACENGGTCAGPNKCTCAAGFIGPTCSTTLGADETAIFNSLAPTTLGIWPFTGNLRTVDVTNNHNDAKESTTLLTTTGPFGGSDTALQTTNSNGTIAGHLAVVSDALLFSSKSWTIATYVKMITSGSQPIFEFHGQWVGQTSFLWQANSATVDFNSNVGYNHDTYLPCRLQSGQWQYIAITYVTGSNVVSLFCNNSFVWASGNLYSPMKTGRKLYFGHRMTAGLVTASAAFACASVALSALNETQLNQLKSICPILQGIPCSVNCILDTCSANVSAEFGYSCSCKPGYTGPSCNTTTCDPACLNGGTCTGPNKCTCATGFFGPACTTILGPDAFAIFNSLAPSMLGYWPLTGNLRAADKASKHNDAQESTTLQTTTGPFGGSDTALQTTNVNGTTVGHVFVVSDSLLFSSKSWTVSTFVKMISDGSQPIVEFQVLSGGWSLFLWRTNPTTIDFHPRVAYSSDNYAPCALKTGQWQFVAVTYDVTSTVVTLFCNNAIVLAVGPIYYAPQTGRALYFGHRMTLGIQTASAAFACASVFLSVLNETKLNQLKSLCPIFQGISCSINCILDTCSANVSAEVGYSCTCKPGYIGPNCNTTTCDPTCQNGGTCAGPNKCTCATGFFGPVCTIVLGPGALAIFNSLAPSMVGYWPLTGSLRAADITNKHNDAQESTTLQTTTGPFGGSDTALQTTNVNGTAVGHVFVVSDELLFISKSWTMSTYVKIITVGSQPLVEFQVLSGGQSPTFWQTDATTIDFHPRVAYSSDNYVPCALQAGQWQFVAVTYAAGSTVATVFCNNSVVLTLGPIYYAPKTGRALYFGHRMASSRVTASAAFACASVFVESALNAAQLNQLKSLCPFFQAYCTRDCLNNGTCVGSNICNCTANYTGSTCETPICNLPCQNGGTCTAPNTCTCPSFYAEVDCSIAVCSPQCENGGTCVNPPSQCACAAGWNDTTTGCNSPICTSLCLNGGNCTAPDTCTCATGWNGTATGCDIPACSPTCANGGTCVSPNACNCASGWNGNTTGCNTAICSTLCANGGNCTAPDTCTCATGWNGTSCNIPVCSPMCANAGTCVSPNVCSCASGWNGTTTGCNLAICSPKCENGATCIAPNNCSCATGYNGSACSTPLCTSHCLNGGTCSAPDTCTCSALYSGSVCATPVCTPSCGNGGTCITPPNDCACTAGWNGTACSSPTCSPSCANGGTCIAPNNCACTTGWAGITSGCDTPVCSPTCANGGTCVLPDICACATGWNGTTSGCDIPVCSPSCQNGATCTATNACNCTLGYTGPTCVTPICISPCQNGGTCSAPNTCTCTSNYSGPQCSSPVCSPSCDNGGTCVTPPNGCSCATGWNGTGCSIAICSTSCANGGTCTAPDICTCETGWLGSACTTAVCFPACQNAGNCTEPPDRCSCPSEWTDMACSTPVCNLRCENGGDCTAPDDCSCTSGWKGPTCSLEACYPNCTGMPVVQTDPLSVAYLANVSDDVFIASSSDITSTILETAHRIISSDNIATVAAAGTTFLPDLTNVVKRFMDVADSLTLDQIDAIANDLSSAANQVMEAVTNATTSQPVTSSPDQEIKCDLNTLNQQVKLTRDSATPMSSDQTVQTYDGFNKFVRRLLGLVNANPQAGDKHRFDGGFFAYSIVCLELRNLPGSSVETSLASMTFPKVSDPMELLSVKSALVHLNETSIVTVAVVGYIANVLDADIPYNMITSSFSVTTQQKKLTLNPTHPVLISTVLEDKKKAQVGREQINAKCYLNTIKCDPTTNAETLGTLQRFTALRAALRFGKIPDISNSFSQSSSLNTRPIFI